MEKTLPCPPASGDPGAGITSPRLKNRCLLTRMFSYSELGRDEGPQEDAPPPNEKFVLGLLRAFPGPKIVDAMEEDEILEILDNGHPQSCERGAGSGRGTRRVGVDPASPDPAPPRHAPAARSPPRPPRRRPGHPVATRAPGAMRAPLQCAEAAL
jgi:hypothetical protein